MQVSARVLSERLVSRRTGCSAGHKEGSSLDTKEVLEKRCVELTAWWQDKVLTDASGRAHLWSRFSLRTDWEADVIANPMVLTDTAFLCVQRQETQGSVSALHDDCCRATLSDLIALTLFLHPVEMR